MKLLELDTKLEIDIREGGKSKEKMTIFIRDYTKEESKKFSKLKDKFLNLIKLSKKLSYKASSIDRKMDLYEKAEKFDKAVEMAEASDKIMSDIDKVTNDVEALGGDDFYEERAKESFNVRVSGEGKEALREYAETKGYLFIMTFIEKEKESVLKKQQGV